MNEEIENKGRSGANSISNDVVTGETESVDIVKEENVEKDIQTGNNESKEPQNAENIERNMNISVKTNNKKKKEKKNRNTRSFLLVLIVILVIVITIGLIYLKINDLKEKYTIPKEVESVFEENSNRNIDEDSKYVVHFGDTFDYNDLEFKTISIINGVEMEDTSNVNYADVKDQKHYIVISGLKDKIVQDSINNTIKNEVLKLASTDPDGKIYASSTVTGSFGNILSVSITYPVKETKYQYYMRGLNFDLNTGNLIPFEDMFVASAPIKTIIYNACMKALAWDIDVEAYYNGKEDANNYLARDDIAGVDDYAIEVANLYDKVKDNISYAITPETLYIYNFNTSFLGNNTTIGINLGDYSDYVAAYKRFLTNSSIFEKDCCINNVYVFVGNSRANATGALNDNWVCESEDNYVENIFISVNGYDYQKDQIDENKLKQAVLSIFVPNAVSKAISNPNNKYYISGYINATVVETDRNRTYEYQIKQLYALYKGAKFYANVNASVAELVNTSSEVFSKILHAESKIPRSGFSENPIKDLEYPSYKEYTKGINMPTINYDTSVSNTYYFDSNYNLLFNENQLPSLDEMVRFIDEYEATHNYGS